MFIYRKSYETELKGFLPYIIKWQILQISKHLYSVNKPLYDEWETDIVLGKSVEEIRDKMWSFLSVTKVELSFGKIRTKMWSLKNYLSVTEVELMIRLIDWCSIWFYQKSSETWQSIFFLLNLQICHDSNTVSEDDKALPSKIIHTGKQLVPNQWVLWETNK